jgi:hypothetical protein
MPWDQGGIWEHKNDLRGHLFHGPATENDGTSLERLDKSQGEATGTVLEARKALGTTELLLKAKTQARPHA